MYEIFGESISGKNENIRVGSLQFSTLKEQLYYKDSASVFQYISLYVTDFDRKIWKVSKNTERGAAPLQSKISLLSSHWKRAGQPGRDAHWNWANHS